MQGNSQARRAVAPPDCRKPDQKYFALLLPDPKHWWFLQLQIPRTLQVGALFACNELSHGLVHIHPGESGQAEPLRAQCQGRTSSSWILLPQNSSGSTEAAPGGTSWGHALGQGAERLLLVPEADPVEQRPWFCAGRLKE